MRDLRDPSALGERLLALSKSAQAMLGPFMPLHAVYESHHPEMKAIPDYNANPTTIEKWGRPQDLPPTQ